MKKAGFTLAEVLVTLTIIGVIASLTIPELLTSIQEIEYKTWAKHNYNTIASSFDSLLKEDTRGETFVNYFTSSNDLTQKISTKLNVSKVCISSAGCFHTTGNWRYLDGTLIGWGIDTSIILTNGELLGFSSSSGTCTGTFGSSTGICGTVYVDSNGFKKPNIIGKDIFRYHIKRDRIIPSGSDDGYNCISTGYGFGCATKYLLE